jgi:hypothetical protein
MSTITPSKFDGWLKAEADEPTFTLMARDWRAPDMVLQWAYERQRDIATGRKPDTDMEMVKEARRIARAMKEWFNEHKPTGYDPLALPRGPGEKP